MNDCKIYKLKPNEEQRAALCVCCWVYELTYNMILDAVPLSWKTVTAKTKIPYDDALFNEIAKYVKKRIEEMFQSFPTIYEAQAAANDIKFKIMNRCASSCVQDDLNYYINSSHLIYSLRPCTISMVGKYAHIKGIGQIEIENENDGITVVCDNVGGAGVYICRHTNVEKIDGNDWYIKLLR